ncbi:NADH:ubiquinone oxidoreductase subunit NDUFA12 [Amaricoccus sp.]|uniref:NADH:ubiquinone oxidoreductase subunit NDUFA12 n=1 Tax=Amaricoccus sp. TaxID=1872485 RepID=UPI001B5799A8|nr:NADH:ubiquinone oxidoreductase subunit NDUFA12 [Amaricoccus sp.]MBP7243177.1 NADH:ubiquinone oxidoreductase subunit NDUFA12 [Amaricoccus sp.]
MGLLAQLFTWWNGETVATRLWTARNGRRVGEDEAGNVFYQSADGARRWVIYNGEIEASRIAPEWHGWLHHTWQEPPTVKPPARKPWEKPHLPNLTGSDAAYHPPGSLRSDRPRTLRDYEAWTPD